MKQLESRVFILMLVVSILSVGCQAQSVKSHTIEFKKDKIIEIAYATVEGGKERRLGQEYFPQILPIAAKYGGKLLGSFSVVAITGGEIKPQMVAIFEWDNTADRERLLADKEAQKLFPIRDDALTGLKLAYFHVDNDVSVTFRSDKTYEFFDAWLTPRSNKSLPEYFKLSAEAKEKYGPPKFLVNLKPENEYLKDAPYRLLPQMAGIVEWNSVSSYYGMIADPDFQKAAPLLEESVWRLDMVQATVNIP